MAAISGAGQQYVRRRQVFRFLQVRGGITKLVEYASNAREKAIENAVKREMPAA